MEEKMGNISIWCVDFWLGNSEKTHKKLFATKAEADDFAQYVIGCGAVQANVYEIVGVNL